MIKRRNMKLAPGGLMRCCTDTLARFINANNDPVAPGTIVKCAYEKPETAEEMILGTDGVWRWNHNQAP